MAAALAAVLALVALPQLAGAVLSGTNGRIVFASGRDVSDAEAKLHFWRVPASALDPAVSLALTPAAGVQHRHPTWSPDRTQIAYARGAGGVFDIFIQDLTAPVGTLPVNITNTLRGARTARPGRPTARGSPGRAPATSSCAPSPPGRR